MILGSRPATADLYRTPEVRRREGKNKWMDVKLRFRVTIIVGHARLYLMLLPMSDDEFSGSRCRRAHRKIHAIQTRDWLRQKVALTLGKGRTRQQYKVRDSALYGVSEVKGPDGSTRNFGGDTHGDGDNPRVVLEPAAQHKVRANGRASMGHAYTSYAVPPLVGSASRLTQRTGRWLDRPRG
ncbi:hypothetical protein C8R44DRAFT_855307 [Mycena epipterygia]|nr:hypothetical protein C8R44DRAFT_855307 [Mycena epipterygia]